MIKITQRNQSAFRRLRSPGRVLCRPGNPPVFNRQYYVSMHCKSVCTSLPESESSGYSFLPVCGESANPTSPYSVYWSQETGYLNFRSDNGNKNLNTSNNANSYSVRCVQGRGRHPLGFECVDNDNRVVINRTQRSMSAFRT